MIEKTGYNDHMVKHGSFAMVANNLWRRKDLDNLSKIIWCFILSEGETWNSSRNNICRELGMGPNTVTKAIKELQQRNMLVVSEGKNSAYNFEVLPPSKWAPDEVVSNGYQYPMDTTSSIEPIPQVVSNEYHNQEAIIQKVISTEKTPKPKKPKKAAPEVLPEHLPYFEILKKVSLHLKFAKHLPLIAEVWNTAELFQEFLNNRSEFYQQHSEISENYFKFRGTISKVIAEEIGV